MPPLTLRPATPADFPALRPMLLDMGFVEDEEALAARFPAFCDREDFGLLVAEDPAGRLLGYAWVQDYGPHLRSGDSHRTAKLHDLYTVPEARRQGVARSLMGAVEAWARARPLRYVFWYANDHSAAPAYERMGYRSAGAGQEGYRFFEIDFGEANTRTPHPLRGS
ncbi:GNAT family N-acetyltransferase [Deinococcus metallilatus]|uniref:GNAT family N-acetyltransferase n=1 Tax=Deinococcus metallilatus TaxID=1211322 RepID=A0AAJ5F1M3_9DEIO|nr:GNAT family N-acetyltransferase [Deinococcus metallilatus]MBB5296663.1 GNAT superfamily N-acetyltransferase [Deinococcus metallilatus]QBY09251.1 GNAT family N-acetyltransferase [Deinococcus metallilatus]RXJ09772.1 GNAT family N-acetyltransferase [Deinococcus metallilatus]TLK24237.1 GNAT family N-acetyltransferase [Deinococcus metallilatus]GMA13693.1 aminoglycoside acetyltransferase [Deinococcus metallilatus]